MTSSLPKVTSLIAEIYDSSSVTLYWEGNSALDHVSLQRSTNGVKYTTIATDISNTDYYDIAGLTSNINYIFRVIPYDSSGNSGSSLKTNVYLRYDLTITSFYTGTSTGSDMPLYWKGKYYSVDLQYKLTTDDDSAYSDAITVTGTNTYTVTGLDESTQYTFKITPKYASGTSSSTSYTIDAYTGYTASISTFTLDSISSFQAQLSWVGLYDLIKFQYSTTGSGYKTFTTATSDSGDVSGTVTMTDLSPYTRYYFRAVPYNASYSAGTTSDVVSGETLAGINSFYSSKITQTYDTISWVGSYITADLYKSSDGGATYTYLQTYTDETASYTDTDVSEYTGYYYYLQPYGETLTGISSELYVLTDYYSTISATIDSAATKSITVTINSSGSQFKNAIVQLSPDATTYYDASLVYNSGTSYTLTRATGLGDLSQNTTYYVSITPYSLYNISGTSPFSGSTATLGSISTFDLSVNSSTSVYLSWSGYYTNARIEYSTDSTFSSGVSTITTSDSSYNISSLDTQYTTYYFRVIPINVNSVDGTASSILYNPTVTSLYYGNIASSYATLYWSGTNSTATVQTSTDGSTYSDLSGYVKTTATSAAIALKGATVYARAVPYYGNIAGTTSTTTYAPYTKGLSITGITSSPNTISFSIKGGVYDTVKLQYAASSTSTSYIDVSTNIVANTITVGTSLIPSLNTQNTTYYFSLVPYTTGVQSGASVTIAGNVSSAVNNPSITSIYISDISSTTGKLKVNWGGVFSRVVLYESSNNSVFKQIYATSTSATTNYSFTPTNGVSTSPNYYKIIPVSDFSGVYSDLVYSPVITDISLAAVSSTSATIGWVGTYGNVTLQYSTTSSTSGFSDLSANLSGNSAYITGITPSSTAYYFRAVPYSGGGGTAASYKTAGVTSSTIYNPVIKTISITNITSSALTLNWTGVFGNVTIQSSTDNSTFSNLTGGNVYATGTSRTLTVSTSSTLYYRIVPYYVSSKTGAYIPGLNSSVVYNPTISNIYVSSITSSSIGVYWTGTYDYVRLQYSKTGASYTDISSVVAADHMTVTSSHISDLSAQYQTYYFRVVPYSKITNTDGTTSIATGSTSGNTYTPTVNSIAISAITSSSVQLKWSGTYNTVSIQSSSDGTTFSDLYTGVSDTSKTISTVATTTTYYRIKPYNASSPSAAGITSTSVYIPTVSSIAITSVTQSPAEIAMKWTGGTYDTMTVQYSTDNSTFSNLVTSLTGNTTTISSSNISGLDTQTDTYYFRALPYSYGYYNGVSTYDISGVSTSSDYNATISSIATATPASEKTNTINVTYTGTYARAILYYGTVGNTTANSTAISTANSGTSTTTSVSNLVSNTAYAFEIYPYNASDVSGIMSSIVYGTTVSTLYGLDLSYSLSLSSASSIGLSWTNNGYTKIEIYNSSTPSTAVATYYSSDNSYYNSSGTESLSADSSYNYYAMVYDSIDNVETSATVTAYTLATTAYLDVSYTNVSSDDSITINWVNSGYTTFSIYNYTLYGSSPSSSKVMTVTSSSGITTYNSSSDSGDTLDYNTSYDYLITLTNMQGEEVYTTFSATTLASATLSISTDTTKYLYNSIPLVVSGSYSGFKVYVNDDSTGTTFADYVIFDGSSTTMVDISAGNSIITSANNQYSFKLQPYNSAGTYSDVGSSVSAKTLGAITSFYTYNVPDSSSVNLFWDGSFAYVGVETSTSADFSTDFTTTRYSSSSGGVYNVAPGFLQNTKYYFRVTPINQPLLNGVDVSGVTVSADVSGTTLGTISSFAIGAVADISADTISLAWDGSFASIYIYQSSDGGSTYVNLGNYSGKYATIGSLSTYSQYYFYGNPVNDIGLVSYLQSSLATAKTLGTISTFYTSEVADSSSVYLYVDGSYDAVVLAASTSSDFSTDYSATRVAGVAASTYEYTGLSQNTKYYFRVTPIDYPLLDGVDVSGISITGDVSGTTLGTISSFAIGAVADISADTISLAWDGSFAAIQIQISTDGATYTTLSDTYYGKYTTIGGLSTYTQYYFTGTPINDVGLGSSLQSSAATAQTLGTITEFYTSAVSDSSNITVAYDGSFDAVAIETATDAAFATDYTLIRIGGASAATYTATGLQNNKKYYFRVRPITYPLFDGVDACGNAVTNDVSGTTYARITSIAIGSVSDVYTNAIPVTWDGSFSQVYIYYSADGSSYTLDTNSPYTNNYAVIYNLSTYVQYYFVAIPENSVGVISDISSGIVTAMTLGTINNFYKYSVVDSSSVNIYVDGSFNAVCIEAFGGSTGFISRRFSTETDNIYYYAGLDANQTYTFTATPIVQPLFDGVDASGVTVDNSVSAVTWGNIMSFATKSIDISSSYIPLKWSGTFSSVYLEYSDSSTFVYDLSAYVVYDTSGTTVSDLSASTLYYFRVTPINSEGVYGSTSNTISDYTLGSSATLYIASNDVYKITLYIAGGSYATADINISTDATTYSVYATETYDTLNNSNYVISDLSANTTYYFTLTPYNIAGVQGSDSNTAYATTLGNLTAFGLATDTYETTSSTIAVKWSGTYTSVYLEEAASSTASYSAVGYIYDTSTNVSNLAPNTKYYFRATPINSAGNSGTTLGDGDISNVTLATISKVSVPTIGDGSANIAFDGSFATIQLYTADYTTINNTYGTDVRDSGTDISGLVPLTEYTVYFNSYNLNGVLSDTSSITFTTLPTLSKFAVTTADIQTTYIPVTWEGSFNSVQFEWSTTSGGEYNYNISVDAPTRATNITDLSQNTYYYIVATPYAATGATGSAGYMYTELSGCTLPQLTAFSVDSAQETTYYSIPVTWSGYYKDVVIEYSTDNTEFISLGYIYDSSTNLSGLDPNKRYYFRATPLNLADVSGAVVRDLSTVTLGNMTSVISSVYDTSAVFLMDGSFSQISVYSTPASLVATYTYSMAGVSTGTDVSGLLPNATYVFTMTPINSAGVSRTDPSYVTIVTLPKIYSFSAAAIDTSDITITWDGSFNSVDIYMSTTAGSYTGSATTYTSTTKSTTVGGLDTNKRYYFRVIPNGDAGYGYAVSDISDITYSTVSVLSVSEYYDTSATVIFDGSFSAISITVNGATTTYTSARTTGTDISNLLPYTTYSVTSTSTNGYVSTGGLGTSFTTLPKIATLSASSVDFSSVTVTWSYSGNSPDYINLIWNKTGGTFATTDSSGTYTTSPIYISDLSANTRYYFQATPYASSGTGYIVTTDVLTNANAGTFRASSVYDVSAVITFEGVYSSIDISVNGITTTYASSSGTTGTDISNLVPNTGYTATSIIKTTDGSTSTGNYTTFTTLPKLTGASVSSIDSSSVYVAWTYTGNTPSSVTLIWNTTGGSYSTSTDSYGSYSTSPAYVTGLSLANTRYYFQVTPVGPGGSGYAISDVSDVTYGKLTSIYTSAYYDTSAVVAFDGSFASIDISANGVTTTYTTARDTGVDISNLTPGETYVVTTVLRNSEGYTVAGNSISFTTLSKITGFSAAALDSSSISVSWTATGSLSYVTLVWNTTGGSYDIATDSNGTYYTSPAYITGLSLANARYYFQITPTSSVGDGYKVMDASSVTYGTLSTLYTSAYYDTSAVVAFDGSFASIDISANGVTTTYTTSRDTGVDISNLTPGETYVVTTVLRNSAGDTVAGNSISFTTMSKITGFSATAIDASSINVYWTATGSLSYVTLVWNTTGGSYDIATDSNGTYYTSPAYITGLSLANARYYFQITPTSSVGDGYKVMDASSVTYGTLATLYTAAYYDTSAVVAFDGSFASIDISTNGVTTTYTSARDTGVDISNLTPGATYTVTSTLRNSNGYTIEGNTITFTTRSKITGFNAAALDSSSISVSWTATGALSYVTLVWNTTGGSYDAATDSNGTYYTSPAYITGLELANARYYFQITPTSSVGDGYKVMDASSVTYGTLATLYTAAYYDTSAVVAFDGSFDSIDISTNGVTTTYTTSRDTGVDISNLTPGETYVVSTKLRNSAGATVDGNSISFTTRSKITSFNAATLDNSSVSITWAATGAISYVTLIWNTTGGSYNVGTDSNGTYTTSPIYVTNLPSNVKYYFQITPTSSVGDGYSVSDASSTTAAKMTYISAIAYDTSAIIYFDGSFANIDVSANSVKYTYGTTARSTATDISNLTPNTSYTAITTLYNSAGSSIAGNTITFTTLPKLATATTSMLDSSSLSVAWTYSGAAPSSVTIIWNTTGGTYDAGTDSNATYTTSPAYISGLSSNTKYYFKLTPTGTAGTGYAISDISSVTGATLTTFNSTMYDTSAVFTFDGSYSYVDLSYSTATKFRYYYPTKTTGTDISNLLADMSYTITITAYNSVGVSTSSTISRYTVYTNPKVTKFTATAYDGSGISLLLDGSFTSVTVQYNTTGGTFYSTDLSASITAKNTAYIVNGLYPYTKYYFRATPVSSTRTGFVVDASAITKLDFSGVVFFITTFT